MYGVGKFYCGLDLLPPDDSLQQILKLNSLESNHDLKFALKSVTHFKRQDLNQFYSGVLDNSKFQKFLQLCFDTNKGVQAVWQQKKQITLNSFTNLPQVGLSNIIQLD